MDSLHLGINYFLKINLSSRDVPAFAHGVFCEAQLEMMLRHTLFDTQYLQEYTKQKLSNLVCKHAFMHYRTVLCILFYTLLKK